MNLQLRSLKDEFGQTCWKAANEPIFRFWTTSITGQESCCGVPFFSLMCAEYSADTVLLYFPVGTVVITGPKAFEFYELFCAQRATAIKADGEGILSVQLGKSEMASPALPGNS
jgi:hypothetical protein